MKTQTKLAFLACAILLSACDGQSPQRPTQSQEEARLNRDWQEAQRGGQPRVDQIKFTFGD